MMVSRLLGGGGYARGVDCVGLRASYRSTDLLADGH